MVERVCHSGRSLCRICANLVLSAPSLSDPCYRSLIEEYLCGDNQISNPEPQALVNDARLPI
jgi:hypothetical protein